MFITNASSEKSLKSRLKSLIKYSEELKFLVGFFYFSGIKELYEELKKLDSEGELKKGYIKILVGLDIDKGNWSIYEGAKVEKYSNSKGRDEFFNSIIKAFTSKETDNKEIYEQVDFFLKLLKEGKLIIKKTKEPNHAKLYLFKFNQKEKIISHLFITGSSNLTKAGLESQREFNVEIKDYGFKEAEEYFDKLWKESIDFTEEDIEKIIKIIKEKTILKQVTPYEAYAYLLKTYIELHKGVQEKGIAEFMRNKGYKPYVYQLEAISQALQNCKYHNGTLIADVVGLGKTIVASLVAKSLGKRGIVICPPHLVGNEDKTFGWKKYLEDFELYDWEVRSLGKLDEVLEFVKDKNFEVVIIDEAHRFRNEDTERYHYLREICRGKTVILLTATPFNNEPSDIFSLLKLFNIPKKSTIVYDENLLAHFQRYEVKFGKLSYISRYAHSVDKKRRKRCLEYYKEIFEEDVEYLDSNHLEKVRKKIQSIAKEIRSIIEPVTIRRNRLDLKYYEEKIEMSEVKDPKEVFFELSPDQLKFYDEVINSFLPYDEGGKFKGAIYFPAKYEKKYEETYEESEDKKSDEEYFIRVSQESLYNLMRRLLVKRFESSFGAFKKSIENFVRVHKIALEFVKKTGKFILDRKWMEEITSEEDEEKVSELLLEYEKSLKEEKIYSKYYKIYDVKQLRGFVEDIESDIKLFEYLLKRFEELKLDENDPKVQKLIEEIRNWLVAKRKVVVFTEYVDTARYLEEKLEKEFKDKLLPAYGNLSKWVVDTIYENFDAQHKVLKNDYHILLTTDKLSEGFNLNRAGIVINYDIPWNPVRVIQRVGRINRIAKKVYDEIFIVNFFPTEKGADIVKSREIAEQKMFMIHNVLGEDAKIFSPDEEPKPSELYRRLTTYKEDEEESFFSKVWAEYKRILKENPDIERISVPSRVKVSKAGKENELIVFIRKGKDLFVTYKKYDQKQPIVCTFENVFDKIRAEKEEKALPLSDKFWENYQMTLDKNSYFQTTRKPSQSLEWQAYNLLSEIIKRDDEDLKPYEKFISDLIDDIRDYGTLSEHVLSEIVSWNIYSQRGDIKNLVQKIEELKGQLGEDFLDKILRRKDISEEVIIAIENQRKEE